MTKIQTPYRWHLNGLPEDVLEAMISLYDEGAGGHEQARAAIAKATQTK